MDGSVLDKSSLIVEGQLKGYLEGIQQIMDADAMSIVSGFYTGIDDLVREAIEGIQNRRPRLFVVLETFGGSIDVAERIAHTLRHHYTEVEFAVPNYAYSAGTILAASGDSIYMDYYAVLGPIDPQVKKEGVGWVPALGYLVQYENLIEKSRNGTLTTAEVAFLLKKFDPAELHFFEQAKEQTITLLKQWLVQYKFKDWTVTETSKSQVTPEMKTKRAAEIAQKLNDTKVWHSHGRGISMQVLTADVGLKIDDFSKHVGLPQAINCYYRLLKDYMQQTGIVGAIHTTEKFFPIAG